MQITPAAIKELRNMTGAGMMECKQALQHTSGDIKKALIYLRERGVAAAEKKSSRTAAEGMVYPYVYESGIAVIVEVNTETDFAAKNETFISFVKDISSVIAKNQPSTVEELEALNYPGSEESVGDELKNKILVVGENIKIRRFEYFAPEENAVFVYYNHHLANKIGVLVELNVSAGGENVEEITAFGKDVCMGVAANRPEYISRKDIPTARIEQEKEILKSQAINEGKPEAVAEKIVMGRISKLYNQICLLDQPYIRDQDITVDDKRKELEKELGYTVSVSKFVRYECGEGIEKKADDFACEVERMMKE